MKWAKLLQKFKEDPEYEAVYKAKALQRQRRAFNDPLFRERHRIACIVWTHKKERGLKTRDYTKRQRGPPGSQNLPSLNSEAVHLPRLLTEPTIITGSFDVRFD